MEKKSPELRDLKLLLDAAECDIEDVRDACIEHSTAGLGMDAKIRIIKGIEENIEKGFNEFYKQENIKINVDINPGRMSIYINTLDGPNICERQVKCYSFR